MDAHVHPAVPPRRGDPPALTHPTPADPHPHQQLSQNAPVEVQDALLERARGLPGVRVADSCVSVPGARAFHLDPALARGPQAAFQRGTEFAHLHPPYDGSLHMTLPPEVYDQVLRARWGDPHPISGTMMVFGPRDAEELEVVWRLLVVSHRYALGPAGGAGAAEAVERVEGVEGEGQGGGV